MIDDNKPIIRVKINRYDDRSNMVIAIAGEGNKVWIEEKELFPSGKDYYVCFDLVDQTGKE